MFCSRKFAVAKHVNPQPKLLPNAPISSLGTLVLKGLTLCSSVSSVVSAFSFFPDKNQLHLPIAPKSDSLFDPQSIEDRDADQTASRPL
jgi:hypothetical protein